METPRNWSEFREALAEKEHERWSREHQHILKHGIKKEWENKINISYVLLPEHEKEKDRKEVDEFLPIIKEFFKNNPPNT